MKTYYIEIEEQGNLEGCVKVNANTYEEAVGKAALALMADKSFYHVDLEQAKEDCEDEGIIAIDEDGDEIDLEEDE